MFDSAIETDFLSDDDKSSLTGGHTIKHNEQKTPLARPTAKYVFSNTSTLIH
jgi:hypothetical protein